MKILIRLAAAGFALLVAGVVAFYVYIDVIASAAVERGASYALGVEAHVGFVRIGPLTGSFRIGSLAIDNPPGFEKKRLLRLADGRLDFRTASLRREIVEVLLLDLAGIDVDLEKAKGRTNFGIILANLKRFEASGSKPAPAESGGGKSEKRFIVKELRIRDITARVEHTEGVGELGSIEVSVPEVRLADIGARNARGVTMSELTNIVTKAVFEAVALHAGNLPGVLAAELRDGLGGLAKVPIQVAGSATGAVTRKLPGSAAAAARQLGGEVGKKALEGLGGLFGGRKDGE